MYRLSKNMLKPEQFSEPIEYSIYKGFKIQSVENFQHLSPKKDDNNVIEMKFETLKNTSTSNPNIWGPAMWFTLHNTAIKYPINASPLYISKMKDFIMAIPYILPCEKCKVHANNYIDTIKDQLDFICSGRDSLFKFFVDFHNSVNKRNNKKEITYEEAYKLYNSNVNVTRISYN